MTMLNAFDSLVEKQAISHTYDPLVSTGVQRDALHSAASDPTTSTDDMLSADDPEQARADWKKLLDHKLISWSSEPRQFLGSGIPELSSIALHWANLFALHCKRDGVIVPARLAPTPHGGVLYEWVTGDTSLELEFAEDGKAYLTGYVDDDPVDERVKELPSIG